MTKPPEAAGAALPSLLSESALSLPHTDETHQEENNGRNSRTSIMRISMGRKASGQCN